MVRFPMTIGPAPYTPRIQAPANGLAVSNRIASAAMAAYNRSSRHGPDGGNLACAFMVNEILWQALGKIYGADPTTVADVRNDLLRQGGRIIPPQSARPGDLAMSLSPAAMAGQGGGTAHIGIAVQRSPREAPVILSNSSSRRAFNNVEPFDAFARRHEYFELIRPVEALP